VSGGEFGGLGPDELVVFQKAAGGKELYRVLDVAEGYVSILGGRVSTKAFNLAVIRSFFVHNRAPLPLDPGYRVRSEKPPVLGELSYEDARRIVETSNSMFRAVFLCMAQGLMGFNEISHWSKDGRVRVQTQINGGEHPLRVSLPGRKRTRNRLPFYTFVGREAIDAITVADLLERAKRCRLRFFILKIHYFIISILYSSR